MAVIHGVQHMFHAPAFLERWPSDDRRSRLVFIARELPREFAEMLLDAIEAEVRETKERHRSHFGEIQVGRIVDNRS